MTGSYAFHRGTAPLLVSIPHAGTEVPDAIFGRLSEPARKLPDTDWHVPRLYAFVKALGASVLAANTSRYVVDLNRPPDGQSLYAGQATTGLCPDTLFDGRPLYADGQSLASAEVARRRQRYWRPYHEKLAAELDRMKQRHGYALLYDAHSIASRVPRLFDGRLPDLNLGTARGRSCAPEIETAIADIIGPSSYSSAVNGRFVGGYITRHYGDPAGGIHAVQMEIAQCSYMGEVEGFPYDETAAADLQPLLRRIVTALLETPVPMKSAT